MIRPAKSQTANTTSAMTQQWCGTGLIPFNPCYIGGRFMRSNKKQISHGRWMWQDRSRSFQIGLSTAIHRARPKPNTM
jgi:hypothetical protein